MKRFSFSFCTCQGSHPPPLARRRACNLPKRKLKVFEIRCLVRDAVFVKFLSCWFLYLEHRVDGLEWGWVWWMRVGRLLILPFRLSSSVGHWVSRGSLNLSLYPQHSPRSQLPLAGTPPRGRLPSPVHKGQTWAMQLSGIFSRTEIELSLTQPNSFRGKECYYVPQDVLSGLSKDHL